MTFKVNIHFLDLFLNLLISIFVKSTGGSLFSLGSNTLKLLKACSAAPIKLTVPCNKLALLSWQNKTLNLSFHDNRRFSYQI